ncbi:hypothetical protein [Desulfolutivibrio sp.]|uniref:hypothetical protein n=1 Tax=Desulfolutivibrio sp. TaxID=2773296 RepID=UPI002F968813
MDNSSRSGRPAKPRHPVAGGRLRQALRILGKNWRKNTNDPEHVLNWEAWTALNLPRSSTTIDTDIRLGVPEERLAAYAQCLGVSPKTLLSPETDLAAVLGAARLGRTSAEPAVALGFGPVFRDEYPAFNSPHYLDKLFVLLGGVYRAHYVLPIADFVNRCAFWVHGIADGCLAARGLFMRFGLDNPFQATIFRWHNNLHVSYLCDNNKELGHFLLVDPLRHNLVARRNPFWLKGQGITDSGLADNMPVSFAFCMQKLPTPDEGDLGELWDRECADLRRRPGILPGDAEHASLREEVTSPDTLL